VQTEDEGVAINSDATVAAVEHMKELFERAMTDEIFAWNAASNNEGLIAGELSYILNSISAFRSAQDARPDIAEDVLFVPALSGPADQWAAQHVMYNWLIPEHATNVDAAKEFLLHYTDNLPAVTWHSKLYDFPAFDVVPQLDGWLDDDPFGSDPPDKLAVLKNAVDWSTNIGHPGPANPAIGQVFGEFILPDMLARAARGEVSPREAVEDAEEQITAIFEEWRQEGLIGG
jgi:multiple sugar transport system substrate-binding protein